MLDSKYTTLIAVYILFNLFVNARLAPIASKISFKGSIEPLRVESKDGDMNLSLIVRLNMKEEKTATSTAPSISDIFVTENEYTQLTTDTLSYSNGVNIVPSLTPRISHISTAEKVNTDLTTPGISDMIAVNTDLTTPGMEMENTSSFQWRIHNDPVFRKHAQSILCKGISGLCDQYDNWGK